MLRTRRTYATLALAAALAAAAPSARAVDLLYGYTAPATLQTTGAQVVGISLTASTAVTFNSLGYFDYNDDGLIGTYPVGLWDAGGTLLASATVTPSSPLINGFRWAPIPATTVGPGSFTVGALLPGPPIDVWLEVAGLSAGLGFTGSGNGLWTVSNSLVQPTTADTTPYFVVNASTDAVPEPATLGVLAVGAAGLLLRRRR